MAYKGKFEEPKYRPGSLVCVLEIDADDRGLPVHNWKPGTVSDVMEDGRVKVTLDEMTFDQRPITTELDPRGNDLRHRVVFVNAYAVTQHWGGPEEGGWWYDGGSPLASIPCATDGELEEAEKRLANIFGPIFAKERSYTSATGDGVDLRIATEDWFAMAFPDHRPHYE